MTADAPDQPDGQPLSWSVWWHLFGLAGLVLAHPVLSTLAGAPTFLIAHGVGRGGAVVLALTLVLLPPTVAVVLMGGVSSVSARAGRSLARAAVGLLAALAVVVPVDAAATLPLAAFGLVVIALTIGGAHLYGRSTAARRFLSVLGVAPLLSLGLFLWTVAGPQAAGADHPSAASDPAGGARPHVLVLVLDELPLGALLAPDGSIDGDRFPGFARLANLSTWYPRATTVAPKTTAAVPAILTGQVPRHPVDAEPAATVAEHPRNLFTLAGETHDVRAAEWVTDLCPPDVCREELVATTRPGLHVLIDDLWILAQHHVLPRRWVEAHVAPVEGRWANFRGRAGSSGEEGSGRHLEAAIGVVRDRSGPTLWFVHERLPHRPPEVLPDGTRYERTRTFDWFGGQRRHAAIAHRQQFLLQVAYVDGLLGRLLDRLDQNGVLDDLLLVVVSDHGLSFEEGGHPRALASTDAAALDAVVPVPLFVRYPGQPGGRIDDRIARTIDVVPTVADVLGLSTPWADGRSLRAVEPSSGGYWQPVGPVDTGWLEALDPASFARTTAELFPAGGPEALFRPGPFGWLVGEAVPAEVGRSDVTVIADALDLYERVDPASGRVPALFQADAEGAEPGSWLAISIDERIAGVGVVAATAEDGPAVEIVLTPDAFSSGPNRLRVFELGPGGAFLEATLEPRRG